MSVRKLAGICLTGPGLLLMALGLSLTLIQPARAQSFEHAVAGLNADSYDAKVQAVDQLAALRDHRAIPILAAMEDGRLFVRAGEAVLILGEKQGRDYRLTDRRTRRPGLRRRIQPRAGQGQGQQPDAR